MGPKRVNTKGHGHGHGSNPNTNSTKGNKSKTTALETGTGNELNTELIQRRDGRRRATAADTNTETAPKTVIRTRTRTNAKVRIGVKTKTKTRAIRTEQKQRSLRLTKERKELVAAFINSEQVPSTTSSHGGNNVWRRKLFNFLHSHDRQVQLSDVNRWLKRHPWIVTVGIHQLENQNEEDGTPIEVLPQVQLDSDNGDDDGSDEQILKDCMEAHRCILALSNVLHKRDEFRSALINLPPIVTQISRVQSKAVLGIPREEMLNRAHGIRIKKDVSSSSQNQGPGQGQGQGGQSPEIDEDDD